MDLSQIKSLEQLEGYLREFVNCGGDAVPYDSGAVAVLLGALLDNLRTKGIEADFEEMQERLAPEQAATLKRIASHLHS